MHVVTLSCRVTPRAVRRASAHGVTSGTLAGCTRVLPPATRRNTSCPRLGIVRVASGDGGGKISDDVDEVTKKYGLEAGLWKVRDPKAGIPDRESDPRCRRVGTRFRETIRRGTALCGAIGDRSRPPRGLGRC